MNKPINIISIFFLSLLTFKLISQPRDFLYHQHLDYSIDTLAHSHNIKSILVSMFESDDIKDREVLYTYNNQGKLLYIKICYLSFISPLDSTIEYAKYDNNNRQIFSGRESFRRDKKTFKTIETFSYTITQSGKISKQLRIDSIRRDTTIWEAIYDNNDRLILNKFTSKYYLWSEEFLYNKSGKLVEKIIKRPYDMIDTVFYHYYTNGTLYKTIYQLTPFDNFDVTERELEFNKNGKIIRKKEVFGKGTDDKEDVLLSHWKYKKDKIIEIKKSKSGNEKKLLEIIKLNNGLIFEIIRKEGRTTYSREVFTYEFY